MELRYWALLIFLGAIWGSAFIFTKTGTPEFGPIALVNVRLIIASLIFLPFLLQPRYLKLLPPIWKYVVVLAVTNCAIPFTFFSLASLGSDSNMLAILNSTVAFNTMIIAFFWLNESVTPKQVVGLVIGFVGLYVLVNPESSSTSLLSSICCLIGSFFYSFSNVFIQKYSYKTNKLVLIGWSLVFSSLLMLPITLFNLPTSMPSNDALLSVLWLGAISTGFAFLGYVRLIEKIGAVRTSIVAYLLPIFGIIWGRIFLDEVITFNILIGCGIVLVGIFLATSNNKPTSQITRETVNE